MPVTLPARPTVSVGATRVVRVNYTDVLDDGATLTGTPTMIDGAGVLTLDNKAVNSATYSDAVTGTTVAVGKAVLFTAAGGVAGTSYTITVTVSTDSSPAETLVYDLILTWE